MTYSKSTSIIELTKQCTKSNGDDIGQRCDVHPSPLREAATPCPPPSADHPKQSHPQLPHQQLLLFYGNFYIIAYKTFLCIHVGALLATTIRVVIFTIIICNRKTYLSLIQRRILKKTGSFLKHNIEDFMKSYTSLAPKQYSYLEVKIKKNKKMTNSF